MLSTAYMAEDALFLLLPRALAGYKILTLLAGLDSFVIVLDIPIANGDGATTSSCVQREQWLAGNVVIAFRFSLIRLLREMSRRIL